MNKNNRSLEVKMEEILRKQASKQAERGPLSVTRTGILNPLSPVPLRRVLLLFLFPASEEPDWISRSSRSLSKLLA